MRSRAGGGDRLSPDTVCIAAAMALSAASGVSISFPHGMRAKVHENDRGEQGGGEW